MTDLYTTNGKEILRNCVHFGDADSEDAARQIVAALNGQMQGWRPIDIAPHDGTPILLFSPDAAEPQIFTGAWVEFWDGSKVVDGNWTDIWTEQPIDAWPTHFQPLPPPPEQEAATI